MASDPSQLKDIPLNPPSIQLAVVTTIFIPSLVQQTMGARIPSLSPSGIGSMIMNLQPEQIV